MLTKAPTEPARRMGKSGCPSTGTSVSNTLEMEANNKEVGTLLALLQLLEKYDYTDSKLEQQYGLSRMSLRKIRQGRDLPNAHAYYFKVMLGILKGLLDMSKLKMDEDLHHRLKDVMFKVMLQEFGVA